MQKGCAIDEDRLQSEWLQFTPGAKSQRKQEASIDGTPSYVEFPVCLEMERDMATERKAPKTSK